MTSFSSSLITGFLVRLPTCRWHWMTGRRSKHCFSTLFRAAAIQSSPPSAVGELDWAVGWLGNGAPSLPSTAPSSSLRLLLFLGSAKATAGLFSPRISALVKAVEAELGELMLPLRMLRVRAWADSSGYMLSSILTEFSCEGLEEEEVEEWEVVEQDGEGSRPGTGTACLGVAEPNWSGDDGTPLRWTGLFKREEEAAGCCPPVATWALVAVEGDTRPSSGDGKESLPMACLGWIYRSALGDVLRGVRRRGSGGPISKHTWPMTSGVAALGESSRGRDSSSPFAVGFPFWCDDVLLPRPLLAALGEGTGLAALHRPPLRMTCCLLLEPFVPLLSSSSSLSTFSLILGADWGRMSLAVLVCSS